MRTTAQGYGAANKIRQRYGLTERDDTSGLDHTWWRKYESYAGRWTSADPYAGSMAIGDPQSFNRYSYVQNDPTNLIDPTGLCLWVQFMDPVTERTWWQPILCNDIPAGRGRRGPDGRSGLPGRPGQSQKQAKEECDTSDAAVRRAAHEVASRIPGAKLGTQNKQPVINFSGSYHQTVAQLRGAGYYSGIRAFNPKDHAGGMEFRAYGSPGFHFKVVYPEVKETHERGRLTVRVSNKPATATDLHIDCNNPVGAGARGFVNHARDFLRQNLWWLPQLVYSGP